MEKILNCFIIIFLNLFLGGYKLDAQQVNSLKTKYCTIIGKISDTSLINQSVRINLMQQGKDDSIESILIHQDKTKQDRYFTIRFSKSDSNNMYILLFEEENDQAFQPFFASFFLCTVDSIFIEVKKKENKISLVFKDRDNIFVNNTLDSIDSNFKKNFSGEDTQNSLKILFFKDIIKLIEKYPEAGLSSIWQYRRVAFTDSLDNIFMKILYDKIDSLSNIKFKHPIINMLNSEIRPNRPAFDFLSQSIDSSIISINRYKGSYCLLDFWASWCGPCRKKNQELKQYYHELSSKGLRILSISIDEHYGLWKKAVMDDNLPWDNAWIFDKKQKDILDNFYKIDSIPTTILINPDGNVIDINPSLNQIKNALKK